MGTLLEEARQAQNGLDKVRLANQVRHQLAAVQRRASEWDKCKQKRVMLAQKVGYIAPPDAAMADITQANKATQALCAQVRQLLLDTKDIEVLSQDDLWLRLLRTAEKANKICEGAIRTTWKALIQALGAVESSSALAARVPATPGNEKVLTTYSALYSNYATLATADMPAGPDSAPELEACVEQLRKILSTLTPAPDSVHRFFKAIETGGATLDLITEEVLEWLKRHDDWTRFVVKTRVGAAWR